MRRMRRKESFMKWMGWMWLVGAAWHRLVAGEKATAVAVLEGGAVVGVVVAQGGTGYVAEPAVVIRGGGGDGATARAKVEGGTVVQVVVVQGGQGYTSAPDVLLDPPPGPAAIGVELVPKLTVTAPVGSVVGVEWSLNLAGPWEMWTNVVVGTNGAVLVDMSPSATARFYRVGSSGPPGFAWIPPGTFDMGSPVTEADRWPDEVLHPVTLSRGFWMCDHEVTQAEYVAVMGTNPSWFKGDGARPVEWVTWGEATEYCRRWTERERASGRITSQQAYRLPTESEWEYAARAGSKGPRHGVLDDIAWWLGNGPGLPQPVKGKSPNDWGLYDMIGNVWEWCADWAGGYPEGGVTDPTGPVSGSDRVARGGGWGHDASYCRSAFRYKVSPGIRAGNLGFRVAFGPER
jgi:formylglycine-generating enzyme required for sulfatase activity